MKRFSKALLIGLLGSLFCNSAKADFDHYSLKSAGGGGIEVYTCINSTGVCTKKATYTTGVIGWNAGTSYVDKENNLVIHGSASGGASKWLKYDASSEAVTALDDWKDDYAISLQKKLIRTDSNGITSIGENSLKLKETSTEQQLWGTNSSGQIVPINITNGSKLLINGRDVEQSIDNVGALSAALTALPTVPTDSPIACGIGTGTHSRNYAFSGGCASKVNEKLSFNAAASFVPGQDYQGTDNSYSARAGFVFKLGELKKPTQISLNESKVLQKEVKDLKAKNDEIISQNQKLLARLEKLENIALKFQSSSEMISVATKD